MTLKPSEEVIVTCHERLTKENPEAQGEMHDDVYTKVDALTAEHLGVSLESVGEALVSAGKRPPLWWIVT